jgi:zinc and cadmium transporter|tara:strand:+ start:730 stop:1497 length:768 start_codon:yes stop_codon:yes gene_type:complete
MSAITYTILSVIAVSLVAVVAAFPLLIKKKISQKTLLVLLSLSVGTLFGSVFIHFIPEAVSHGYTLGLAFYFLLGIFVLFILEKLIHWRHSCKNQEDVGHSHAYHLAPINLIGDAIHNLVDGMVIAGSYIVSIPLGIAATISVIFHEVPQEIADFGILLYSGMSRLKALFYNFLSAATAILGAVIGLILAGKTAGFTHFIIPFAAGNFIYIAGSNLVPELHKHCKLKDTILHIIAIICGIAVMVAVTLFGPGHTH